MKEERSGAEANQTGGKQECGAPERVKKPSKWGGLVLPAGIVSSIIWNYFGLTIHYQAINVPYMLAVVAMLSAFIAVRVFVNLRAKNEAGGNGKSQILIQTVVYLVVFAVFLLGWLTGEILIFFWAKK